MSLRFGIVGCGMIGRIYGERLVRLGHQVVAASDPDLKRARLLAGNGSAFADHRDLLAAGGVDVVCICNPSPLHHATVLDCAAAGTDMFLEKPMSMTLDEAVEMRAAAAAAGCRVGFGFKMRFEAVFATARRLIAGGAVGVPRYAILSFYQPTPPGERIWYADVGVLRDMHVHMVDLATWFFDGQPRSVRARTDREVGRAGEDKAFIDLELGSRREIRIQGGYLRNFPDIAGKEDIVFQVVGEEGYLVGRRPEVLIEVGRSGTTVHEIAPVDAFAAELKAFSEAILSGAELPVSDADGLNAQAAIDAAERSAAAGGAVVHLQSGPARDSQRNPCAS